MVLFDTDPKKYLDSREVDFDYIKKNNILYLYSDSMNEYYSIDSDSSEQDIVDFIENNYSCNKLYLTNSKQIHINADEIVKEAAFELHDDAYKCIPADAISELRNYINMWCKRQKDACVYYPDYTKYVTSTTIYNYIHEKHIPINF